MTQFVSKAEFVQAIQYTPKTFIDVFWFISKYKPGSKIDLGEPVKFFDEATQKERTGFDLTIDKVSYRFTDGIWLVINKDGNIVPMSEEDFQEKYEPLILGEEVFEIKSERPSPVTCYQKTGMSSAIRWMENNTFEVIEFLTNTRPDLNGSVTQEKWYDYTQQALKNGISVARPGLAEYKIFVGSWIVRTETGNLLVLSDEEFHGQYIVDAEDSEELSDVRQDASVRTSPDLEKEVLEAMEKDLNYPLGESDPMKWAVAWRLIRDKNKIDANGSAYDDIDGWMVGWFANCMASARPEQLMTRVEDNKVDPRTLLINFIASLELSDFPSDRIKECRQALKMIGIDTTQYPDWGYVVKALEEEYGAVGLWQYNLQLNPELLKPVE